MNLLPDTVSPQSFSAAEARQIAPLDLEQLRRRCLDRLDLVERLLNSFERRFPLELAEIEHCLATEDVPRLIQLAHRLKGASANISAPKLHSLMQKMEQAARDGQLDAVAQWLGQLQSEWEEFAQYKGSVCLS